MNTIKKQVTDALVEYIQKYQKKHGHGIQLNPFIEGFSTLFGLKPETIRKYVLSMIASGILEIDEHTVLTIKNKDNQLILIED